jgi:DNA polymerase I-like protein with 3'-5' exonuclease and polymerase domains
MAPVKIPTSEIPTTNLLPLPAYDLPWDGRPFTGLMIAFDTETVAGDDLTRTVPELVLMQVYDGRRAAVLRPDQVEEFIRLHDGHEFVGHNVRFDYWVLMQHLEKERAELHGDFWKPEAAMRMLREMADEGRLHDTKILDFLLQLAREHNFSVVRSRSLADLVKERLGKDMPKDQYRMEYASIIGKPWEEVDRGFFDYAVRDVVGTFQLYKILAAEARLAAAHYPGTPTLPAAGPLTEALQVRADLALAEAGRTGLAIDRAYLTELDAKLNGQVNEQLDWMEAFNPGLFSKYKIKSKRGDWKLNKANGLPILKAEGLREVLIGAAQKLGIPEESLPRTKKTGLVATGLDYWADVAGEHPFVQHWKTLVSTAKHLQFCKIVGRQDDATARTDYQVLVRTGRTSARQPNIQNMPKEPWFRRLFVARPGYKLVIADYSAIELVTLAAVLTQTYGKSVLADVLRAGRDPHSYTASLVLSKPYEEIRDGVQTEKARGQVGPYSQARQAAKAINFGVPGGLGPKRLALYAKYNYGAEISEEQAKEFRDKLTQEVYPELQDYLRSDDLGLLSHNLRTTREQLIATQTHASHQWLVRDVMLGRLKLSQKQYGPWARNQVWNWVAENSRNPRVTTELARGVGARNLDSLLWGTDVWTLTGRKRAGVTYTEARNTPFQGLAADGAKVALWELHKLGFRVVAFVHDEIVVEVTDNEPDYDLNIITRVMKESMASVLGTDLPVGVEAVVADRWIK